MSEPALLELRRKIAVGCRILAHQGLAEDVLGHISVRRDDHSVLVRCRGPRERGLLFTEVDDVRQVSLIDGVVDDGQYAPPNELPIHTEALRSRPTIMAVVHAHPPSVIAAELAGLPLVPLFGAYNIPAARMAIDGVRVYPRGVLIRTRALAAEMLEYMGDAAACVLRGHGITTVGSSVEQAVLRALALDSLARMTCRVAQLGGVVSSLPKRDLDELPDLGGGFNEDMVWRHYESHLELSGLGL